jgi:hypothetical protein
VYNIEVEAEHCYFVGSGEVLTHNECSVTDSAKPFNSKQDTDSETTNAAFRNAKDQNGIPRSKQPDRTRTVPDKHTGKPLTVMDFTNSKGEQVSIRKDNPVQYKRGSSGDQGVHYNAGETKAPKLKQHHNVRPKSKRKR